MSEYPETVNEVLADVRFKPAALRAVRAFAACGPWKGSLSARKKKFRRLYHELTVAYAIPEPELIFGRLDGSCSDSSCYVPALHRVTLKGRLSVVTALHEFGHARGMGERAACQWSINLFRRCFPEQFSKLEHVGHTLVRRGRTGGRALPVAECTGNPEGRQ